MKRVSTEEKKQKPLRESVEMHRDSCANRTFLKNILLFALKDNLVIRIGTSAGDNNYSRFINPEYEAILLIDSDARKARIVTRKHFNFPISGVVTIAHQIFKVPLCPVEN